MAADRSIDVVVALSVTLVLATISLALRLLARRITQVQMWWDDWFAIAAYFFALAWTAAVSVWVTYGLGRFREDIPHLTPDEIVYYGNLMLYNAEIYYAFSLAFSKFAILAFFWRMFKTSNIRWPIKILFGCSLIWLIIRTVLAVFHCWPIEKFWDVNIDGVCPINDSEFFFGTVLVHLLIDIAILVLPVWQVRQLQLARGQKIAVIGLFTFGILVCVASIVVLVESANFDPYHDEVAYNVTPIMVWASVEVNLAIVSACLPMLRPIFKRLLPGSVLGSGGQSQHISRKDMDGAVKLTTLGGRSREDDESSSTHNLADPEHGKPPSGSDYEANVIDGLMGPHTVISSRDQHAPASRDGNEQGGAVGLSGIMVKNETTIQVSNRMR